VAQVRGAGEPDTIRQLSGELAKQHRLVRGRGSQRLGSGGQRVSRYRFRHILFQKQIYAQARRGLATFQATGAGHDVPYQLGLLAQVYQTVGQTEQGLSTIDEALVRARDAGGCYYEAELHRLKGEYLLTQSQGAAVVEAEACFQQIIEVARQQKAKSWELRAVMSLSRLWQRKGERAKALGMLAEIYDWFTEGFDTTDLRKAKTLLEELSR
jgi:predicted ATPase